MATIVPLTMEQKRAACREMADWLEGRRFGVTVDPGADVELAKLATLPDDIGELGP